jgi:flagellar hook-associated protein 2
MTLPIFNFGGLVSGIDTNAMIDALVDVERIPIRQLESRKAGFAAKDKAWQTINTKLSAIRTALNKVDTASDLAGFVGATSSNEAAVGVTVTGSATPGSSSFTVNRLAANHQLASATDFAAADDLVGAGDFTITLDGTDHTVTADGTTTLAGIAQQINELDIEVSASIIPVDGTTSKLMITSDETGAAAAFTTSGSIASLSTMNVVQQGDDAELVLGSGPGALTLSRASNEITDLIAGVTIDLHETTTGPVTVTVNRDGEAAATAIEELMTAVNDALSTIGTYTAYNAESNTGGVLVGDSTARSLVDGLRRSFSGIVNESATTYKTTGSVGISLNRTGTFDVDGAELREALDADFDEVADLLISSGNAPDARLTYLSAGPDTVDGDYEVVITQAATQASTISDKYKKPNADTTFQIVTGGTSVDVSVLKNDDVDTVIQAITDALSAAGVTSLSVHKVTVGADDFIQIDHSAWGSGSEFDVVGDPFGLAGSHSGQDVAGTIGGEAATGTGRTLTADTGDPTALTVRVTATDAEVSGAGGSLSLGDVSYSNGVFGALDRFLNGAEGSGGSVSRARDRWAAEIDFIDDRIAVMEDRVDRREQTLIKQFAALETAMATLSSQASWLAAQLPGLSSGSQ